MTRPEAFEQAYCRLLFLLRHATKVGYRVRGAARMCEYLRRWVARHPPKTPLVIHDFRGNAKFVCYLSEHMGSQIFLRGSYSQYILQAVEKALKPDSIFVDVGANQGEFSIAAGRLLTEGRVVAIEPVSEWARRLQYNVRLNGLENITVLQVALGAKAESRPIYNRAVPRFIDGTHHDGLTSLFPSAQRTLVVEHVQVERWDDIMSRIGISKVDVMKLDIEGGEWYALQGAQQTLERFRPILFFELETEHCRNAGYEAEDFLRWLVQLGYRLERIHKDKTVPIGPKDILPSQNAVAYPE